MTTIKLELLFAVKM